MKKILYSAAAMALAFFAASCQQENLEPAVSATTVTYTVEVPGALATRALGDETTAVDKVYYQVYRATEVEDLSKGFVYDGNKPVTDGKASFELEFVKNQNFVVLFWAQDADLQMFNIVDLRKVTLTTPGASNNVNAQVFAGSNVVTDCVPANGGKVTLSRPISQLNIATTAESLKFGTKDILLNKSTVTVKGLYPKYNVYTEAVSQDKTNFEYTEGQVPGTTIEVNGKTYTYVAMNYVGFAPKESTTVDVDFTITTSEGDVTHKVPNVPVKPNFRTNIIGNLLTEAADYDVTLDAAWDGVNNNEVIVEGLVKNTEGVYEIYTANGLAYASQNLFAQEGGSYVLTADVDMAGASSVATKAADALVYNSASLTHKMKVRSFEFDGKGYKIKNLPGMFIAYTGSANSVVVKNLTLETPNVAFNVADTPETDGVGAFIGYAGTTTTITLDNCHVKGGRIEGGHWTGGLVGYAAGYSGNDGPVFETLTIKDCSVKNATVTGKGSCGAIIGHATGDDWTLVDMDNIVVTSNSIISTGDSDNKAGSVMGTLGNAGQPKTVNGVTKTGGVTIDSYEVSGNTVKSNNVDNAKLWGRQGNSNGVLTIDGEKVEAFDTSKIDLSAEVNVPGATVNLLPGEYKFPNNVAEGVTINCAPGTVFTGTSGLNINGSTVIGATFENEGGVAVSGTIYGTFKNCTFEGEEALRWCYSTAGKEVVFEDCVIKTDFRGFHFDGMEGDVLFKNCEINGFNAFGGEGTATFENCVFGNDESRYNGLNTYANTVLKNCQFNFITGKTNFIDMEGTGYTLTITNCTATLDGVAKPVTDFVGGSKIDQNTVILDGKVYVSTAAQLTAAVNNGATDIVLAGEFEMPSNGTTNSITFTSLNGTAIIDNTKGSYWENATLTFNNISFKTGTGMVNGNGADYAALYSKNVTYNSCTFTGPMRLGRDGAKFNACTFNGLGNDYVWTYGMSASFEGCTFNTEGKAILIYSDGPTVGTGAAPAVSVTNCTFNATQGAKAGAIANQNCAAVEIHNYGNGVTLTTSGNTVDEDFSGVWRIKTYENRFPDSKIFVNGTEYTTIALDGKTMTIDANKNVTVL